MRTEDVRGSASRPQETADWFGGSAASSRIDGIGTVYAGLVLSVPSLEFEAALDDLHEVTTDKVGGEDVTEEFVDLRSRERNLLSAEESLLRLYAEAESVDDPLDCGGHHHLRPRLRLVARPRARRGRGMVRAEPRQTGPAGGP